MRHKLSGVFCISFIYTVYTLLVRLSAVFTSYTVKCPFTGVHCSSSADTHLGKTTWRTFAGMLLYTFVWLDHHLFRHLLPHENLLKGTCTACIAATVTVTKLKVFFCLVSIYFLFSVRIYFCKRRYVNDSRQPINLPVHMGCGAITWTSFPTMVWSTAVFMLQQFYSTMKNFILIWDTFDTHWRND